MRDSQLLLSSGRTLAYTEIGEPGWPCVFFFHGAPMSRLHLAYLEQDFHAAKVRVIAADRPGYGGSSPQRGRLMTDWPNDVTTLADVLEIDRFAVAGHSSGGPYAVACAAQLQDRVSGAVVFGGVTDMAWPEAWRDYLDSERQIMRLPDEMTAISWCTERYGADGAGFFTASDVQFGEPDNALFADERAGPLLMAALGEGFRQGVSGYAQDILIQGRAWAFNPAGIGVGVYVLHGEADTLLPFVHSQHTAELIPDSILRVLPGHGHVTTVAELPALSSTLF